MTGKKRPSPTRTKSWNAYTVHALRQHMGATQQEMAEETGTRQQTISEWETGMYRPRGASQKLLSIIAARAGFQYTTLEEEVPGQEGDEEPG